MTDLEKLKTFLDSAGIEYSKHSRYPEKIRIECKEGDKGVGGYDAFFTDFEFDIKGKFILMGAWE